MGYNPFTVVGHLAGNKTHRRRKKMVVVGAGVVVVSGHGGGVGAGVVVVSGHGAGVVGSGLAWPFSGLAWPFSFVSALPVKATLDSNLGSSPWGSSPRSAFS